jgi:hypothetical protein
MLHLFQQKTVGIKKQNKVFNEFVCQNQICFILLGFSALLQYNFEEYIKQIEYI